jgi:hypothetical protein
MIQSFVRPRVLLFLWPEVLKAVNETRSARKVQSLYGAGNGPGIWLFGDHGVYLMSNTTAKSPTIVYAHGCDPTKLPFNTWWAKKQVTFGGDDGVEFTPLSDIETLLAQFQTRHGPPRFFYVAITPDKFSTGFQ